MLLSGLPLISLSYYATHGEDITDVAWNHAGMWLSAFGVLFAYANYRCSSDTLSYRDGLLIVGSAMRTGWSNSSLFVVFPSLFIAFFGSVLIAAYNEIAFNRANAPLHYEKLILFFYKNRMVQ